MSSALEGEVERLRAELDVYRQRELDDLRRQLSEAEHRAEHYRLEAQRNADAGRAIAAEYEKQLVMMRSKLEAAQELNVGRARGIR